MRIKTISLQLKVAFSCLGICVASVAHSQTLFQTAKDDAIITFRSEVKSLSQIKLNVGSSALGYGYYYSNISDKGRGWLLNINLNAKPSEEGITTVIKEGRFQPGIKFDGAIGYRSSPTENIFSMLDIYLKPEYGYNSYSLYDVSRITTNQDPLYKTNRSSFGINGLLNYVISPSIFNIYFGAQFGILSSDNAEELSKASIQTIEPYPGSSSKSIISGVKEVKRGQLEDKTKMPLKLDLIFDTGITLFKMQEKGTRLGTFGYYRTDLKDLLPKNRIGVGLSFLDPKNPSKILTSIGYELPGFGKGITTETRSTDKGIVFVSVGYTIFK